MDKEKLLQISKIFTDEDNKPFHTPLPMIHSIEILSVLMAFTKQDSKLGNYSNRFHTSRMWEETGAQRDGTINRSCVIPDEPIDWTGWLENRCK